MRTARTLSAVGITTAAALLLAACGADTDQPAKDSGAPADKAPHENTSDSDSNQSKNNLEQALNAIDLAEAENDGLAVAIEATDGNNWEVEVREGDKEWDYLVNEGGIEILQRGDDDDPDDRSNAGWADLSLPDAINAAYESHSGALDSAELEEDDDKLTYEVTIIDGSGEVELTVDASDGKTTVDRDDQDDDGPDERGDDRDDDHDDH